MYNNLKETQYRLLSIGIEIKKILERHNIPYILSYGTLLGAVRHSGFIPWDDDFDLILFDDTYDYAIELLRNELPDNLFLEDSISEPKFFHAWAHVKDLKSEAYSKLFPQDNYYSHHGLSVDLYKAKLMKENLGNDYLFNENLLYLNRRLKNNLISNSDYRKKLENAQNINSNLDDNSTKEVYILVNSYKCKKLDPDDIFPLKRMNFEGEFFLVPNNSVKVLTDIYGDFMKLPNIEDRHCHYDEVKIYD